ncbi:MAG: phosphoribosylanthranilate isomerase [Halolamina sp.]
MPRVKVCGLTRSCDLDAAVAAGADAVGFISGVSVDTDRELDLDAAAALVAATPPFVTSVLVTMPDDPEEAAARVERVEPDAVQLHGEWSPAAVETLRGRVAAAVVVAVDYENVARARDLDPIVDALLVDSTADDGAGGTGETHDWETTRNLARDLDSPLVLAGGLTPDNVADAVETVRPFGVDVASGVEREPGIKDTDAVRRFVHEANRGLAGNAGVAE